MSNDTKPNQGLDPGFKKNLMFIGGGLAIVIVAAFVGYLFLSGLRDRNRAPSGSVERGPTASLSAQGPVTPQYANEVNAGEAEEADRALANGRSHVPSLVSATSANDEPVHVRTEVKPSPASNDVGSGGNPVYARIDENDMKIINEWRQSWGAPENLTILHATSSRKSGSAGGSANTGGLVAGTAKPVSEVVAQAELPALESPIVPVLLRSSLDSDNPTEVSQGEVVGSPWKGALLTGSVSTRCGDRLCGGFTNMYFKGAWYTITSTVVDPDDNRGSLSGNVDHRLFTRYFLPVVADMASIYGQTMSTNGTVTSNGPGGVTTTTDVTPQIAAIKATGSGLQKWSQQINADASQTQPQVSRPANLIAILVTSASATSSAQLGKIVSGAAGATSQQAATQPVR